MNWDFYTVSAVICGLITAAAVYVPGLPAASRVVFLLVGLGFCAFGIYVANQTEGTYVFPAQMFGLPLVSIFYIVYSLREQGSAPRGAAPPPLVPPAASGSGQPWMAAFQGGSRPPATGGPRTAAVQPPVQVQPSVQAPLSAQAQPSVPPRPSAQIPSHALWQEAELAAVGKLITLELTRQLEQRRESITVRLRERDVRGAPDSWPGALAVARQVIDAQGHVVDSLVVTGEVGDRTAVLEIDA